MITVAAVSSLYFCLLYCCLCDIPRRNEIIGKRLFCLRTKANYICVCILFILFLNVFTISYDIHDIRSLLIYILLAGTHADSGHTFGYFCIQNLFSSCISLSLLFELLRAFASWRAYVLNETETTKIFSISFTPFFSSTCQLAGSPKPKANASAKAATMAAAAASTHTLAAWNANKSSAKAQVFVFVCGSRCRRRRHVALRAELSYATHSISWTTMTLWVSHKNPEWLRRRASQNSNSSNKKLASMSFVFILLSVRSFRLLALTHLRHALGRCNGLLRFALQFSKWEHNFLSYLHSL